jgi:hypothetical protein
MLRQKEGSYGTLSSFRHKWAQPFPRTGCVLHAGDKISPDPGDDKRRPSPSGVRRAHVLALVCLGQSERKGKLAGKLADAVLRSTKRGRPSEIEWTDATWNPVSGCVMVSPGCTHCYAMRTAARLQAMDHPAYRRVTRKSGHRPVWSGRIHLNANALSVPSNWRKPRKIFVNSKSDLFQDGIPADFFRTADWSSWRGRFEWNSLGNRWWRIRSPCAAYARGMGRRDSRAM